jgi:hypothetical protein
VAGPSALENVAMGLEAGSSRHDATGADADGVRRVGSVAGSDSLLAQDRHGRHCIE